MPARPPFKPFLPAFLIGIFFTIHPGEARNKPTARQQISPILEHPKMTYLNLVGRDFSYASFQNMDLTHANLKWATLAYAHMDHLNLSASYLDEANLQKARLHSVNLCNSSLIHTNLFRATLQDVDFSEALLNRSSLKEADAQNNTFFNASLISANLTGTNLSASTFENADLRNSNFKGADLKFALFKNVNLHETHLEGARNLIWVRIDDGDYDWITRRFLQNSGAYYDQEQLSNIEKRDRIWKRESPKTIVEKLQTIQFISDNLRTPSMGRAAEKRPLR